MPNEPTREFVNTPVDFAGGLNNGNADIEGPFFVVTNDRLMFIAKSIRNPGGDVDRIGIFLAEADQHYAYTGVGEYRFHTGQIAGITRIQSEFTSFDGETYEFNAHTLINIYDRVVALRGYTNVLPLSGEMGATEYMMHACAVTHIGIVAFVRPDMNNTYAYVIALDRKDGKFKMYDGSFHYWPENGHFSVS